MIRIFLASPPTFTAHVAFVEDQVPSLLGVAMGWHRAVYAEDRRGRT